MDARAEVDAVVDQLLREVGLGDVAQELRGPDVAGRVIDAIEYQTTWKDDLPTYPYDYPLLGQLIEANLREVVVKERPELIVELASLLMLSPDIGGNSAPERVTPPEALAYAILRAAHDVKPSCDIQLSLAFLVSLGLHAPYDGVRAEAEPAVELCPGDPTPLWLLGTTAASQSSVGEKILFTKYAPEELTAFAEGLFEQLRRQYPDSPLGWAGAADLWLNHADEAEGLGVMPFRVREWRRDALAFYEHARALSTSARLLPGHVRALSAAGRSDEAAALADQLLEMDPRWAPYQALLVDVLIRGRAFDRVLEILKVTKPPRPAEAGAIALGDVYGFGLPGHRRWAYDLSFVGVGAGGIQDLSFFPDHVQEWVTRGCVQDAEAASLIAEGLPGKALARLRSPDAGYGFGPGLDCRFEELEEAFSVPTVLMGVAASEAGDLVARDEAIASASFGPPELGLSEHWDARQDFWRWVGDRARAIEVVRRWMAEMPDDPWASQRLGELRFLDGDYQASASELQVAVDKFDALISRVDEAADEEDWIRSLSTGGAGGPAMNRQLAMLQLGTALEHLGKHEAADAAWTDASRAVEQDNEGLSDGSIRVSVRAQGQAGAAALLRGDYDAALDELRSAVESGEALDRSIELSTGESTLLPGVGPLRGAEHNNLAIAASKAGDHALAVRSALAAVQLDRANPVFRDTLAFTYHQSGDIAAASDAYRETLAQDSTSYASANNLAVIEASVGNDVEALALLEEALASRPDYATAWHNVGVVRARERSPQRMLASQGALARAALLDRRYRGRDTDLVMDDQVYDTGVDISRPIPPDWTYVSSASEAQRGFTLTMLLLVVLRVAWALGLDHVAGWVSQKVVDSSPARVERIPWFWRRMRARWALATTAVVLAVPAAWGLPSWLGALMLVITGTITFTPFASRFVAARPGEVRHFGWTPAVAVGLAGAPVGLAFAPWPALDDADGHIRWSVRWAPTISAASVVAVLTAAAVWTAVPYLRGSAMVALILLASILTPAPPFDGHRITGRLVQLGLALALAALSLAFTMGWV